MKEKEGLEFEDQLDYMHADPWPICKVRTTYITLEYRIETNRLGLVAPFFLF